MMEKSELVFINKRKMSIKKISLKWIISFLNCLAFFKEMKWMNKYKNKKLKPLIFLVLAKINLFIFIVSVISSRF